MPQSPLLLTARDLELLKALARCVRVLSLLQIARAWWGDADPSEAAARPRAAQLYRAGFLQSRQVLARSLGILKSPIVEWRPGLVVPEFGAVAWRLRARWNIQPTPTTIYFATRRTARLFGGRRPGRVSRAFQVSHDLGVAEMFLAVRRDRPWAAKLWIDEDRFAAQRRGQKLPDAVLASTVSQPQLVLEFGASYSKSRLQAFHDDNARRGLPYEVW